MAVRVLSWNLFHGNTKSPERHAYLEEMVRLAARERPDVVFLQELPVWALRRLGEWSGMTALGDVAQAPTLGPLPITAELGRRITAWNVGLFRSAFAGQANAILVRSDVHVRSRRLLVLNPPSFRRRQARALRLGLLPLLAWGAERRVCQVAHVRLPDDRRALLANMHATSFPPDHRIPCVELERALEWLDRVVEDGEVLVVGGDLNQSVGNSRLLSTVVDRGFSSPGPRIDHILVRAAELERPLTVWPTDRRRADGRLLSDHAPVELTIR
jgi:endonuclease/exonuclease/phosphatase family metal-dependent hydrolase